MSELLIGLFIVIFVIGTLLTVLPSKTYSKISKRFRKGLGDL